VGSDGVPKWAKLASDCQRHTSAAVVSDGARGVAHAGARVSEVAADSS